MRHPTDSVIAEARRELAAADADLALAEALTPAFAWRTRPGGFAGLARLVVEQQVSTASADAIWRRLEAGLGTVATPAVLAAGDAALRGFGLSQQKARYLREIALAEAEGRVDFARLDPLDDEQAVAALTAIKGVGRWTAEIYLMFCEGRPDLFPAADLALQEAMRAALRSPERPSERTLRARSEAWRPWRGVAAHLLWRFYGGLRRKEISPPA